MVEDNSRVDEVLEVLNRLKRGYVEVGILGDSNSDILIIAGVNEFGANIRVTDKMRKYLHYRGLHLKQTTKEIKIPERAYIRGSFDENVKHIERVMEDLLIEVIDLKRSPDEAFKLIGEYSVGLIQDYMTDLKSPSNHPFTIEQKGSSNPLIDTGRLRGSITYRVKYR